MPHELFLTAGQKTKIKSVFANNLSTDIKLSKTQFPKKIKSHEFLGTFLVTLTGPLRKFGVPLAKNFSHH